MKKNSVANTITKTTAVWPIGKKMRHLLFLEMAQKKTSISQLRNECLMEEYPAETEETDPSFLALANQGKTRWHTYLAGVFVMGSIWIFGSVILIVTIFGEAFVTGEKPLESTDPVTNFVTLCLTFVALIAGLWVAISYIHKRPLRSLITPYTTIRQSRLWQGFKWQIILIIAIALIEELLYPGTYHYTLDPKQFYTFLALTLLFIPLQATSEELLMRGYFLQGLAHFTRHPIFLICINGLAFMALHFANPEIEHGLPIWLTYFAWGAFLTFITLKDNTTELAIGIHVANNMFASIFVNYEGSALPTNTVLTAQEIHPWFSLISYVLSAFALYWILLRPKPPTPSDRMAKNNDAQQIESL